MATQGILSRLLVTFLRAHNRPPPQTRRLPILVNLFQLADQRWLFSRERMERIDKYRALIEGC